MKRNTIHKIPLLWPLLMLTACADGEVETPDTLSGDGSKTPLAVTAVLDASLPAVQSRATDAAFADGDNMVAYLRHVTWNGSFTTAAADVRTPITADQAPRLVTLTHHQATGLSASYTSTGDATVNALYWDDFSTSASDATDLRTAGHYLQSYYGYCYNGGEGSDNAQGTSVKGNITRALDIENGTLGWRIQTNQSSDGAMQHSDLLWSVEQKPVSYFHREANVDTQRPGLTIPYTHAMSKVTIRVTAGIGFASNYDFAGTAITLKDVRTTCTATAPTATLDYPTDGKGRGNVTMFAADGTTPRAFSAIIVPSVLTVGNTLATITGMDGNTYTIPVTDAIVNGWGSQLTAADEDVNHGTAQSRPRRADAAGIPTGSGHQMKSGVHYVLNVTLDKTSVNVSAEIAGWDEIEADGVGEIHFANDIQTKGDIDEALRANGFDVYKSTTTTFGPKATTLRWMSSSKTWKYDPTIYWRGGMAEYFRALSNVLPDVDGTQANESLAMANNRDALWGTTEAHSGTDADGAAYNYGEGSALKPRTGDVPLVFYHAMSKITFHLVDANKANTDPLSRLDLHNATIQLTDLATGGTLDLSTGLIGALSSITAGQKTFTEDLGATPSRRGYFAATENGAATSYNTDVTLKDYIITPQSIGNAATVVITLADGSVYKAQLNKCTSTVVEGGVELGKKVDRWERGKHYVYTITLSKETITFRAAIRAWDEVAGSGNATLEWD